MKSFDAIIIGFGKGGKTLAGKLAGSGKTVAMIEKSNQMYGGTCINVGCIPSKSLIRSAGLSHLNKGGSFEERAKAYTHAVSEKRTLTAMLRKKNYDKLNENPNVTVYDGTASFLSNTRIQVSTGTKTIELEGKEIFINTGSKPVIPPIEGLKQSPHCYSSETLMDLQKLPPRLVIIGGGYIGLEFASMYSNFGSKVTVLQEGERLIPREDMDIAEQIQKALEEKGITFQLNVKIHRILNKGEYSEVVFEWQGRQCILEAEVILIATGRKPNTDELNTEAAGVKLTARGAVEVDETLHTSAPNIWAMGDVAGGLQFTYISLDDFRVIWSQKTGGDYTTAKRQYVPYSVFIDPGFSRVGFNEQEALEQGYSIKVAKLPVAAIPKAQVLKNTTGILKAVVNADTNKILGAMLFCEESYEMINIIKLAMDFNADYTILQNQIFTHPTMSEALNDLFSAVLA